MKRITIATTAIIFTTILTTTASAAFIEFTDKRSGSAVMLNTDLILKVQEFKPPTDGCLIQIGREAFHIVSKEECDRIRPQLRKVFGIAAPPSATTPSKKD